MGTVLSTSPMCSLYKIVVLPAASKPNITTCSKSTLRVLRLKYVKVSNSAAC